MKKLGFIGGGNMAEALARGLLGERLFSSRDLIVSDVDPLRRRKLSRALAVQTTADNREVLRQAPAVVIAVKPQTIDSVLDEVASALSQNAVNRPARAPASAKGRLPSAAVRRLFISIAAGVSIARLEAHLGAGARVIRVMPNAPAMVGEGMAALAQGSRASRADLAFALKIFRAVGDAVALEDESLLDAVTALSGSGPAYVYLFIKALAEAAAAEGLPMRLAMRMALQTVRGAERNMRASSLAPAELIRRVASPGGTTEAALRRFDAAGFSAIVASALRAAAAKSRDFEHNG